MRIVCWQTIFMKYHSLFFSKIKKDVAKFLVCCSRDRRLRVNYRCPETKVLVPLFFSFHVTSMDQLLIVGAVSLITAGYRRLPQDTTGSLKCYNLYNFNLLKAQYI